MYFDNFEFYYICEMTSVRDCFEDDCEVYDICSLGDAMTSLLQTVYAEGEV